MNDCLVLMRRNISVENLANRLLLATIFALILRLLSTTQFIQTYSETPWRNDVGQGSSVEYNEKCRYEFKE